MFLEKNLVDLIDIKGIGPMSLKKLNSLGIYSVQDLLLNSPSGYINLEANSDLSQITEGEYVLLKLKITSIARPFTSRKVSAVKAKGVTDENIEVGLIWWNANYMYKLLNVGEYVKVFGKISMEKGLLLSNPKFEVYSETNTKFIGIEPIYRLRKLINQGNYRSMVSDAIEKVRLNSIIDESVENRFSLMNFETSIRELHKPSTIDNAYRAENRIAVEDIVRKACSYRLINGKKYKKYRHTAEKKVLDEVLSTLPYSLTKSQKAAVDNIVEKMHSNVSLNTILVGDVGSGKTIVSILAAYYASKSKLQTAFVAPTEVLAMQHYNNFKKILSPFNVSIRLLSSSTSVKERNLLLKELFSGKIDILIGTHSLFSPKVIFQNLGLAIIDEQHKFGVAERSNIFNKIDNVDSLMLSATPIPRSLRLTMLGEIDYMTIENRFNKKNVGTFIVPSQEYKKMLEYIVSECEKGRQAFFIAPKIFDCEGVELSNVEKLFSDMKKNYGSRIKFAYLHGKLEAEKKQEVLNDFAENRVSILISTTVVEVGIDVPNANMMVIFDAERFGLASLHQLRGRIGRDGAKSYCFLLSEKEGVERLNILTKTNDGLEIAEYDYINRGPGSWFGQEQSGFACKDFTFNKNMVNIIKEIVDSIDLEKYREYLIEYAKEHGIEKISIS